jgi:hypothetical protein
VLQPQCQHFGNERGRRRPNFNLVLPFLPHSAAREYSMRLEVLQGAVLESLGTVRLESRWRLPIPNASSVTKGDDRTLRSSEGQADRFRYSRISE